jgi:hypothetical protein
VALPNFRSSWRALRLIVCLGVMLCVAAFGTSTARALSAHGQRLRLLGGQATGINANKSQNWFGYNQGALEPGKTLFHSIAGNWTVPRATQHAKHQAEYSSDWIGIGGGCENASCTIQDSTLIQTGTEQDVNSNGKASYSAWWEVIPGPSLTIRMRVHPGDHMHAGLREIMPASNVWKISIQDLTRNESYSTTVPYSSTEGSAEWIEETPLVIGGNAGFAPLPNLSTARFDRALTNGHPAQLRASQEIELTTTNGKVVGVPSRPDPDHNGFNACAWATTCPAPAK